LHHKYQSPGTLLLHINIGLHIQSFMKQFYVQTKNVWTWQNNNIMTKTKTYTTFSFFWFPPKKMLSIFTGIQMLFVLHIISYQSKRKCTIKYDAPPILDNFWRTQNMVCTKKKLH
jgi:hypothetical protein